MRFGSRVVCVVSGLALLAARFYPFDRFPLVHCPLKEIAHIPCPACGMTRAFVHLTQGDLAGAIHVSPLGFVLAWVAIGAVAYGALRHSVLRRGWSLQLSSTELDAWRVVAVTAVLMNWVYLIVSGAAA